MRGRQEAPRRGVSLLLVVLALFGSAAAVQAAGRAPAPEVAQAAVAAAAQPSTVAAGAGAAASGVADGLPPLVPLRLLLGTSKWRNAQLSPDGKYLSYNRPSGVTGVYNVFIKPLPALNTDPSDARSVFDREGVEGDVQVTFDAKRGITAASWGEDSKSMYYIQDNDGDENFHLYVVNLADTFKTGAKKAPPPIDRTPWKGVKASGIMSRKNVPEFMYIGLNKRDPEVFDMYRLDVKTGKLTLDTVNPGGVVAWLADFGFNLKGAMGYNNTDGSTYVLLKGEGSTTPARPLAAAQDLDALFTTAAEKNFTTEQWINASSSKSDARTWRRLLEWPFGERGGVFRFTKKGDALYIVTSLGRDTTEFQVVATKDAKVIKRIAANPWSNVGSVKFDEESWEPQMVSFNYLRANWSVFDPILKPEWDLISNWRPGEAAAISDSSNDEKTWLITYAADNTTSRQYLYRRGTWPPTLLFEVQPEITNFTLAKMNPVVIIARDGLKLPAYLTLPAKPGVPQGMLPPAVVGPLPGGLPTLTVGAAPLVSVDAAAAAAAAGAGDPKKSVNFASKAELATATAAKRPLNLSLPLILYVHGGPWSRDGWGADGVSQWLANRGYAVLQVNYRGSEGYGKNFQNLGNKEWGVGSMQHDLTDAVRWAAAKGIADPKKVCIMGGSYGGYATLAGLTFTPELYACGVDIVGIANVGTFMRSIPPYWKPMRNEWVTRVGDAEANATLNRRISPVFHVDKIKAPLLIGQGGNDPRVPQAESDQMYKAMKAKGLDVTYVLYSDEGHGLVRPQNRLDFYMRADQFLSKVLGGRAEPFAPPPGTTAKVATSSR